MGHRQRHRGKDPRDERLFAPREVPRLEEAVVDLSYLASRGYQDSAACKLVGDHFQLTKRQRQAIARAACSEESRRSRKLNEKKNIRGESLLIDGFNILITVETMLSEGILLCCYDGCIRDMASVHGSYRKVEETLAAIAIIGETLEEQSPESVHWLFDSPVSNSARIASFLEAQGKERHWPWTAELLASPDHVLKKSDSIVCSGDSVVLDHCKAWYDLSSAILTKLKPKPRLLDFSFNESFTSAEKGRF